MIYGIGVDVIDLPRFERAITRTPALRPRLFADDEYRVAGHELPARSLAGRFAAKEALIKAFGESGGITWHDMKVVADANRNPSLVLLGAAADLAASKGITAIHLSITHDAGIAIAYVIAETGAL
jgi:holo-[acyl-carrier protein] synthase